MTGINKTNFVMLEWAIGTGYIIKTVTENIDIELDDCLYDASLDLNDIDPCIEIKGKNEVIKQLSSAFSRDLEREVFIPRSLKFTSYKVKDYIKLLVSTIYKCVYDIVSKNKEYKKSLKAIYIDQRKLRTHIQKLIINCGVMDRYADVILEDYKLKTHNTKYLEPVNPFNLDSNEKHTEAKILGGSPDGVVNFNDTNHQWAVSVYDDMIARTWNENQINYNEDIKVFPTLPEWKQTKYKLSLASLTLNDSYQTLQLNKITTYISSPVVVNALTRQAAEECYIDGTEVAIRLDEGDIEFKDFKDLKAGDTILIDAMDGIHGDMYYTLKEEDLLLNQPYKGKIYEFNNGQHVTPGHRIVLIKHEDMGIVNAKTNKLYMGIRNAYEHMKTYPEDIRNETFKYTTGKTDNKYIPKYNYTFVEAENAQEFIEKYNKELNSRSDITNIEKIDKTYIMPGRKFKDPTRSLFTDFKVNSVYDYDGVVHCLRVPTEKLICRYKDKVFTSGNCVHSKSYSRLVRDVLVNDKNIFYMHRKELDGKPNPYFCQELYEKNKSLEEMYDTLYKTENPTVDDMLMIFVANQILEELVFPGGFAFLFSFDNRMTGTINTIAEIAKDEKLSHVPLFMKIFRTAVNEEYNGNIPDNVVTRATELIKKMTEAELKWTKFLGDGFSMFTDEAVDIYVKGQANSVCKNLGLKILYPEVVGKPNPLNKLVMSYITAADDTKLRTSIFEGNAMEYNSYDMEMDI